MPDYNRNYKYNANGINGGAFYNTYYRVLVNLREIIGAEDDVTESAARYILRDRSLQARDDVEQTAAYKVADEFTMDDDAAAAAFFELTDEVGITDEISALLVLAYLNEKFALIDEAKQFAELLVEEKVKLEDVVTLEAFLKTADKFGLRDLATATALFELYDRFGLIDSDTQSAATDFLIGVRGDDDPSYDWIYPFGMKIHADSTSLQIMPEAEITSIEMPGIDGSIIEDTVYKDRLFQIVAYSEDGLTRRQKEDLKSRITDILDTTKHQTRKLTVQANDNSFDVKYEGQAVITEGPSYVKATIPFRTTPYGYKAFEKVFSGSGLVYNNGDAPAAPIMTISGPVTNPAFVYGEISYKWTGTVAENEKLVIDHGKMTCYIEDAFGAKRNVLKNLSPAGKFYRVGVNDSTALTADENTAPHIRTNWRENVLW